MPNRIDVELTSARDDGTWTWRAAGARQPKGNVDSSLLYEGAQVGDVVRADAEFALDGIALTHLYPPKARRPEPERLEVLGPGRSERGAPRPANHQERRRRRSTDRHGGQPDGGREDGGGHQRARSADKRSGDKRSADKRSADKPAADASQRSPAGGRTEGGRGSSRRGAQRLSPGNTHRAAAVAALAPEERPIAEHVLRGGLPAVRQAIEAQNATARAEGRPEVQSGPLLSLAENLLPRLKAAAWRDRAEAALAAGDNLALRDLRSVVTSADAGARDEETRELAAKLREALDRRVSALRQRWTEEIVGALDAGKVLRALRAAARPPDPGARFPSDLAMRLGQEAGTAMTPEVPPARWMALLEAVADSPVRRTVKPAGLPADGDQAFLDAAARLSGRVPAVAGLLGITMPPPPTPPRPAKGATTPGPTSPPEATGAGAASPAEERSQAT
ncbi:MAG TPA: hypothetical protein VE152_01500 [Acidimicrobiales bacterium]|nr:hypothetical protein [Acidimicrobiales bacterium]